MNKKLIGLLSVGAGGLIFGLTGTKVLAEPYIITTQNTPQNQNSTTTPSPNDNSNSNDMNNNNNGTTNSGATNNNQPKGAPNTGLGGMAK